MWEGREQRVPAEDPLLNTHKYIICVHTHTHTCTHACMRAHIDKTSFLNMSRACTSSCTTSVSTRARRTRRCWAHAPTSPGPSWARSSMSRTLIRASMSMLSRCLAGRGGPGVWARRECDFNAPRIKRTRPPTTRRRWRRAIPPLHARTHTHVSCKRVPPFVELDVEVTRVCVIR